MQVGLVKTEMLHFRCLAVEIQTEQKQSDKVWIYQLGRYWTSQLHARLCPGSSSIIGFGSSHSFKSLAPAQRRSHPSYSAAMHKLTAMASESLEDRFKKAVWIIRNGPKMESSNEQKLTFYSYFKQVEQLLARCHVRGPIVSPHARQMREDGR